MVREKRVKVTFDAETAPFEQKTTSMLSRARSAEIAMYRITSLIEQTSRITKHYFGVELPQGAKDAINELQGFIATARTAQKLAESLGVTSLAGVGGAIAKVLPLVGGELIVGEATKGQFAKHGVDIGIWAYSPVAWALAGVDWLYHLFTGTEEETV